MRSAQTKIKSPAAESLSRVEGSLCSKTRMLRYSAGRQAWTVVEAVVLFAGLGWTGLRGRSRRVPGALCQQGTLSQFFILPLLASAVGASRRALSAGNYKYSLK